MDVLARIWSVLPVLLAVLLSDLVFAHPGGLDSSGCHNDRKHGGYHCHRGELAGQSFASKSEMLAASQGSRPSRTAPAAGVNVAPSPTTPEGSGESGQVCIREHRTKQVMCGEPVR
jgi:hypothetical protein